MRHQSAAESGEVEPLHQLRVATRRLRASVELFSNVIYAAQLKIFRRDLPWLGAQAGAVRECDVTSSLIAARAARIDPDLKAAIAPMLAALNDRRNAEHEKLRELLASKRYRSLLAKLSKPAIKKLGADRRLGIVAAQLVRPAARGASRFGEKIADDAPAIVFHKLRVRIKRLRYDLEMIASLGAKRHKKTLETPRGAAGTARPLSRRHRRLRMAAVVRRNFCSAAAHDTRGRRVDPIARQPRKETAPAGDAGVAALRALGRDARYARGNSPRRQIKPEAGHLARTNR